jgi:hypothetical protein
MSGRLPELKLRSDVPNPISLQPSTLTSLVRRSLPSLTSIIGGETLLRIAGFLVVLLIARLYGAPVLGLFAAAMAYATLAAAPFSAIE